MHLLLLIHWIFIFLFTYLIIPSILNYEANHIGLGHIFCVNDIPNILSDRIVRLSCDWSCVWLYKTILIMKLNFILVNALINPSIWLKNKAIKRTAIFFRFYK